MLSPPPHPPTHTHTHTHAHTYTDTLCTEKQLLVAVCILAVILTAIIISSVVIVTIVACKFRDKGCNGCNKCFDRFQNTTIVRYDKEMLVDAGPEVGEHKDNVQPAVPDPHNPHNPHDSYDEQKGDEKQ